MVSIDLGAGLGCISIHDTEEKITPSKPFSAVLEVEEGVGVTSKAILLISVRSLRSIYNSRLRISVNGFNISRIAKPVGELLYKGEYHSIFTYDLMPIWGMIAGRAEVEVDSKDHEIYVDNVSLATIHRLGSADDGYSSNSIYIGPYVFSNAERIYIKARSFKGGDIVVRGVALPRGRSQAYIDLSLSNNNTARRISIYTPTEVYLKLSNAEVDGEEEIELRVVCEASDCTAKIPWIFVASSKIKSPDYIIKNISLSNSRENLILELENLGDIDANELVAIAIWKGNVVGRSVVKPSRRCEIVLSITSKGILKDSELKGSPIIVRVIWKWSGRVEEREKVLPIDSLRLSNISRT
ncbi:MAG: hypothetical protein RQ885_03280 [Desulfurococcales archaeon]|jgi:hypothetical protein|nr:hypothetical protein [Desulfurococcales archaeon]